MISEPMDLAVAAMQAVLATVLLVAGLGKARSVDDFAAVIRRHELVPPSWALPIASFILAVEVFLGLGLMFGVAVAPASIGSGVLFVGFAAVTTRAVITRRQVACGCFGVADRAPLTWRAPVRSLFLAGLSAVLAILALAGWATPIGVSALATIAVLLVWTIASALRRATYATAAGSMR